ncbi:flavin-dependent dehydrogenase [Naumannella cuiyingiana]|uniref:Flavin-dependent dehydrogenase n=1 Tax=Naumannella cuiyingiana TaxID=1347891 RepID=A0A7Z0D7U3_9ACTN|nr:tryptophan 7-halogenase [Naumannella cuiyingiana]NYI70510.1 flavin-dependent dehydrogenase [Naumannella cuiyingiana]
MAASSDHKIIGLSPEQRRALLRQLREKSRGGEHGVSNNTVDAGAHPRVSSTAGTFDVAVLGGGVAGLTFALQLKQSSPAIAVAVVERSAHPVPEAAHKVGESTVEIAAHYLRDVLGLAEHLEQDQIRKFGLRMFFGHDNNTDIAARRELGGSVFPLLATYQLDRGRLENELARRCSAAGIEMINGRVREVEVGAEGNDHLVEVAGRDNPLRARWMVDATGRARVLRRRLGHESVRNGHHANAAWFRVDHPIDVTTWSEDPEWRKRIRNGDRSKSTVHLMGDGYWVWLIRLPTGATSVGIVASADQHDFSDINSFGKALAWLTEHEPQCAAIIERHRDQVLDFRVMRDYSYACKQVFSGSERWAITGEAGIFLDPLYSPGLDQVAIGNSLACDLVTKSLAGADVTALAAAHNKLYLAIADIWLGIYRGQYGLLGNASVMTSKVIWDTAFYWAVFGFLFFHGRFLNVGTNAGLIRDLEQLAVLSNRVQQLFGEWAAIESGEASSDFVDLYSPLNFMVNLHHAMAEDCGSDIARRLSENRAILEQLAGQLVESIIRERAEDTSDATVAALQKWQRDPVIASLRRTYRSRRAAAPTSPGWIRTSRCAEVKGALHEVGAA